MINTESTANVVASPATANPAPDKQLPKKTALRDVQNENTGPIHKPQDILLSGVPKPNGDAIKVCGTKRLTPERPSSSHVLPSLAHNGANENVMNARRRFELELGRGRQYSHVEKNSEFSELKSVGIAQKTTAAHHVTSKHVSSAPAAKVAQEVPRAVESKVNGDHLRAERFARLQKFLKQCDEAKPREYSKRLLHLSPLDLSKHAVELEKRAIQLTIEEGLILDIGMQRGLKVRMTECILHSKVDVERTYDLRNEMQRMKALNILAKSATTTNLLQSTQLLQSSKR
ncbi:hypothetical protein PHJA_000040700 [Phtheirospermum japonicum]|uniref:Uncharacterized protein n=1 Tax=Phtheirospermum japonicum TaxID=374723 RepID=A0A830B0U1_9LAMI|nr:hypothetical protein PHJA_000040700 [Phtheirospermum japonicum]